MRRIDRRWLTFALGLVVGVAGTVAAIAVFAEPAASTIRAGVAHVTPEGGGSFETEGRTAFIPADVHWTDAGGVGHEEGTPECLDPPGDVAISVPVTAATVDIYLNRPDGMWSRWSQVVWVDCRSATE